MSESHEREVGVLTFMNITLLRTSPKYRLGYFYQWPQTNTILRLLW